MRVRGNALQAAKRISDVWFQNLWVESDMFIKDGPRRDRFNEPFIFYIPDCVNFFYRYIVEVDDPGHRRPGQRVIDKKKDRFYTQSGYIVFRVRSHDYDGFKRVKEEVRLRREVRDAEERMRAAPFAEVPVGPIQAQAVQRVW